MAIFGFRPVILAVFVGLAHACSPPEGWEPESLEERAKVPEWVVYGTVVSAHMPIGPGNDTDMFGYKVSFEPLCWLKSGPRSDGPETSDDAARGFGDAPEEDGDRRPGPDAERHSAGGDVGFRNITVVELAFDCVTNPLNNGTEYILFLEYGQDTKMFSIINVNDEAGAIIAPGDESFEAVYRGIDAVVNGDPHGECLEGVVIPCFVGEVDHSVCDKGVAVGVAMWSVVMAVVIAITGY